MDSTKVLSLVEQLDDEIDDLDEALSPLLKSALSATSSKLPLLDKAKLYVLVTYAIESMLFSYLRLHGVKAREHPVFTELTRVKQYFDKIKTIETPAAERNMAVDKAAAARFIKAGLAGNEQYDLERAEKQAKERARAHIKFDQLSEDMKAKGVAQAEKRKASEVEDEEDSESSDSDSGSSGHTAEKTKPASTVTPQQKKLKINHPDSAATSGISTPAEGEETKKHKRKPRKDKPTRDAEKVALESRLRGDESHSDAAATSASTPAEGDERKKHKRKPKKDKRTRMAEKAALEMRIREAESNQ